MAAVDLDLRVEAPEFADFLKKHFEPSDNKGDFIQLSAVHCRLREVYPTVTLHIVKKSFYQARLYTLYTSGCRFVVTTYVYTYSMYICIFIHIHNLEAMCHMM